MQKILKFQQTLYTIKPDLGNGQYLDGQNNKTLKKIKTVEFY